MFIELKNELSTNQKSPRIEEATTLERVTSCHLLSRHWRCLSFLLLPNPHRFSSLKKYPFIISVMLIRSPRRLSTLLCLESQMARNQDIGLETQGESFLDSLRLLAEISSARL